jgi:hypothetical protein
MGDIYYAILVHAGELLGARWREGIKQAVSEGKTLLEISKGRLPTPSTPAQELALNIVDLVEVNVTIKYQVGPPVGEPICNIDVWPLPVVLV